MSWIIVATLAVAALLVLNSAVVMWRRRGQAAQPATGLRQPLTPAKLASGTLLVLALLAGPVVRTVAPESGLAGWIAEHGLAVYFGVCLVWMVVVEVVLQLLGRRLAGSRP